MDPNVVVGAIPTPVARGRSRSILVARGKNVATALVLCSLWHSQAALLLAQCQTVAGNTWVEDDGGSGQRTYTLSQGPSGNITGSSYHSICQFPNWPVTGTFTFGNGSFAITASNPSGGGVNDPCPAAWFTVNGSVSGAGCDVVSYASFDNSLGYQGGVNWSKTCDVPTGEQSTFASWSGTQPYWANFSQSLSGPVNFGGRTLNETFPVGGSDSCYFLGSAIPPQLYPPNWGQWTVGFINGITASPNLWGYDAVGWTLDDVVYYREIRLQQGLPFPCGFSWQQYMNISCSAGSNMYQTNPMSSLIYLNSVSVSRGSAYASR
ncbi:MAG TPA: hypothetical protein VMA31_12635 [Bryobacteraceae bacterium]|nr:hypothetical protein [Bryobacteraceae bacterium]